VVENWRLDLHILLLLRLDVEVDSCVLLGPLSEAWVLLSAELITIAC
jgi:hypothetical protein